MKELLEKFNLPTYLKGDSFAADSKRISERTRGKDKEFSAPEDIALEAELLGRLRDAQEFVKSGMDQGNTYACGGKKKHFLGGLIGAEGALSGLMDSFNATKTGQAMGKASDFMSSEEGQGLAGLATGALASLQPEGEGKTENEGLSAASGAIKGAMAGAALGPFGMAGGAVVGGVSSLLGAGKRNKAVIEKNRRNTYAQARENNNRFAMGGDPTKPKSRDLEQSDLVEINAMEGAPLKFANNEYGLNAANNLFKMPVPVEKANVNLGKYADVNYFAQDKSDPTGMTLTRGSGQIYNDEAIKRQFKAIQALNPGMKLKYNAEGGEIDPPGKRQAIDASDLVNINAQEGAPLQFAQNEYGLEAASNLFEKPVPVEKANVNYGRYADVGYFQPDPSDPTGLTMMKGEGNIYNDDDVKRQFNNLKSWNPDLDLKYNAYGGHIDDMKATNKFARILAGGGPGDPPKKGFDWAESLEGVFRDIGQGMRTQKEKRDLYNRLGLHTKEAQDAYENAVNKNYTNEPMSQAKTLPNTEGKAKPELLASTDPTPAGAYPQQDYSPMMTLPESKFAGFDLNSLPSFEEAIAGTPSLGYNNIGKVASTEDNARKARDAQDPFKSQVRTMQTAITPAQTKGIKIDEFTPEEILTRVSPEALAEAAKTETGKKKKGPQGLENLLRMAPMLATAKNLNDLSLDTEAYGRLSNRYEKMPLDERRLVNAIAAENAGLRNAIVGTSGGSGSAARANLLAASLQGTRGVSDAYQRIADVNRAENAAAQQFNLGVDTTNMQQENLETQANAANKGQYDMLRAKLIAGLGENAGAIGKEMLFRKYPELMGLDYDSKGRLIPAEKKNSRGGKMKRKK